MLAKLSWRINPLPILLVCFLPVGCTRSDPDPGTPSNRGNEAVYYERNDSLPPANLDSRLRNQYFFVGADTGIVIRIQPRRIANRVDGGFPWTLLEDRLGQWLKRDKVPLREVPQAWLIVDRAGLDSAENENWGEHWLVVLDDVAPDDWTGTGATGLGELPSDSNGKADSSPFEWEVRNFGKRRVALGSPSRLNMLSQENGPSPDAALLSQIQKWKQEADLIGLATPGAVSDLTRQYSGILNASGAGNGNREPDVWGRLPNALSRLEWEFFVKGAELGVLEMGIDDAKLAGQFANDFPEALQSARDMAGTVGPLAARQAGPELGPLVKDLFAEFRDRELIQVEFRESENRLVVSMLRPESLAPLFDRLFADAKTDAEGMEPPPPDAEKSDQGN